MNLRSITIPVENNDDVHVYDKRRTGLFNLRYLIGMLLVQIFIHQIRAAYTVLI